MAFEWKDKEIKKQRQGKGQISAFEISISFTLIYLILSFVDFRQCPTPEWGVCGRWGIREREMLKEVRCYGLTICHPTNIFFNSNFQCNGMKRWSLLKLLQKGWKEHFQSHFMRLRLSWYQNQIRTPQEKKILANIPNKYRCKIFNKILENQIQQCMKRILDNPLQYSCLGNLRQRSLESYSPLDHKVSGIT